MSSMRPPHIHTCRARREDAGDDSSLMSPIPVDASTQSAWLSQALNSKNGAEKYLQGYGKSCQSQLLSKVPNCAEPTADTEMHRKSGGAGGRG